MYTHLSTRVLRNVIELLPPKTATLPHYASIPHWHTIIFVITNKVKQIKKHSESFSVPKHPILFKIEVIYK